MNHSINSFYIFSILGYLIVYATYFHGILTCQDELNSHECSGVRCDKALDCFITASLPGS